MASVRQPWISLLRALQCPSAACRDGTASLASLHAFPSRRQVPASPGGCWGTKGDPRGEQRLPSPLPSPVVSCSGAWPPCTLLINVLVVPHVEMALWDGLERKQRCALGSRHVGFVLVWPFLPVTLWAAARDWEKRDVLGCSGPGNISWVPSTDHFPWKMLWAAVVCVGILGWQLWSGSGCAESTCPLPGAATYPLMGRAG